MKLILQSIVLGISFFAVFIEQQFFSDYQIQIIALLIVAYFGITLLRRKFGKQKEHTHDLEDGLNTSLDIFIFNAILMLLIIQTGALYSPIFFLVYFLCFGITFIFEPFTVFIFAVGILALFLPEALTNQALTEFVKVISVIVITPFAFFFGREYKEKEQLQKKIAVQDEQTKEMTEEIKKAINSDHKISKSTKDKLSDILKKIKK